MYDEKHLLRYKVNLIKKIGIAEVEKLENNREIADWTPEKLNQVISYYKAKIIELGFKPSREIGEESRY